MVESLEEEDALSEFLSAAEHVLSQVHESLLLEVTNSSLVPVEFHVNLFLIIIVSDFFVSASILLHAFDAGNRV